MIAFSELWSFLNKQATLFIMVLFCFIIVWITIAWIIKSLRICLLCSTILVSYNEVVFALSSLKPSSVNSLRLVVLSALMKFLMPSANYFYIARCQAIRLIQNIHFGIAELATSFDIPVLIDYILTSRTFLLSRFLGYNINSFLHLFRDCNPSNSLKPAQSLHYQTVPICFSVSKISGNLV